MKSGYMSAAQMGKTLLPRHGNSAELSYFDGNSIWERITYGSLTLIATIGPILAGVKILTWGVMFFAINLGIIGVCCLLGIWKSLRTSTQRIHRTR